MKFSQWLEYIHMKFSQWPECIQNLVNGLNTYEIWTVA